MCGRFAFYSPREAIARLFGLADAPDIEPRWNIAPTQPVHVLRDGASGRSLALLHWGLVPSWAKEKSIGARMNNARGETLADKPSFRNAYRRRRCLIPADGWYEWQRSGSVKQPYYLTLGDGPFAMAGLWETWRDPSGGDLLESCCIVTTSPAPSVAHVHDRMPVIVPPDAWTEWLDPGITDTTGLERLLVPWAGDGLRATPVSRRVNDARNQGPGLIEPLGSAGDGA